MGPGEYGGQTVKRFDDVAVAIHNVFNSDHYLSKSPPMKYAASLRSIGMMLFASGLLSGSIPPARADDVADKTPANVTAGVLVPVDATTDKTWLAQARADYPLTRCPVCGDKLDSKSPDYVYRQSGKPDRLVRFCDEDECVVSFKKDPEKYLKVIDAAPKTPASTN
jgi:YHS domain-containing protein